MEIWKTNLTKAEIANGKPVFSVPIEPKDQCVVMKTEPATGASEVKQDTVKKDKKPKAEKPPKEKTTKPAEDEAPVDIGRLDLRVGHIRYFLGNKVYYLTSE